MLVVTNITTLKLDAIARRACGWHYGDDELPLRSDDSTSIAADQIAEIEAEGESE